MCPPHKILSVSFESFLAWPISNRCYGITNTLSLCNIELCTDLGHRTWLVISWIVCIFFNITIYKSWKIYLWCLWLWKLAGSVFQETGSVSFDNEALSPNKGPVFDWRMGPRSLVLSLLNMELVLNSLTYILDGFGFYTTVLELLFALTSWRPWRCLTIR